MKVIAFDLGGTLMQYMGMPLSWVDFYHKGFENVIEKYQCNISKESVEKSLQILKNFNPRISYREMEYSPEYIFSKIFEHWNINTPIQDCIETFWNGLNLKAEIYPDTIDVLQTLKGKGYSIATLTDLPNGMPDELFKKDINDLLNYIDYYVSSAVAGYRKPNYKGLKMISDRFDIPLSQLIFVGDEEKDRQTALNAGCKFIRINHSKQSNNSINNLYELLDTLE